MSGRRDGYWRLSPVVDAEAEHYRGEHERGGGEERDRLSEVVIRESGPERDDHARQSAKCLLHSHVQPALATRDDARQHRCHAWECKCGTERNQGYGDCERGVA